MKQRKSQTHWGRRSPDYIAGAPRRSEPPAARPSDAPDGEAAPHGGAAWVRQQPSIARMRKQSDRPVWFWPLVLLTVLLLLVFLIIPDVIDRSSGDAGKHLDEASPTYLSIYDEQVRLVTESVVTIYAEPDIKSERLTQVLYNTPVQLQPNEGVPSGFVKVLLLDGRVGYMVPEALSSDRQSVEPNLYQTRVIVTDMSKRVMTHATNGNLLVEVKRGTVLYVLYGGSDLYRVQLPDGREGWLSSAGVIELPVNAPIPLTDADRFAASAQVFDQSKWMKNGLSDDGIDMYGVLRMTGYINGLQLPADPAALWETGETVEGVLDETGRLKTDALQIGDVLFCERRVGETETGGALSDPENRKLAIWIGNDRFLTESIREFAITRQSTETLETNWVVQRVARYFPSTSK